MEILVLDFGNTWFLKIGIKTTYMTLGIVAIVIVANANLQFIRISKVLVGHIEVDSVYYTLPITYHNIQTFQFKKF